jgi:hypothetical protein
VTFDGESGIDSGGLTKEWFLEVSQKCFHKDLCLFQVCALPLHRTALHRIAPLPASKQPGVCRYNVTILGFLSHPTTNQSMSYKELEGGTFSVHHSSGVNNPDHMHYFRFIGHVLGKAVR